MIKGIVNKFTALACGVKSADFVALLPAEGKWILGKTERLHRRRFRAYMDCVLPLLSPKMRRKICTYIRNLEETSKQSQMRVGVRICQGIVSQRWIAGPGDVFPWRVMNTKRSLSCLLETRPEHGILQKDAALILRDFRYITGYILIVRWLNVGTDAIEDLASELIKFAVEWCDIRVYDHLSHDGYKREVWDPAHKFVMKIRRLINRLKKNRVKLNLEFYFDYC
jgi:hypothetical protein